MCVAVEIVQYWYLFGPLAPSCVTERRSASGAQPWPFLNTHALAPLQMNEPVQVVGSSALVTLVQVPGVAPLQVEHAPPHALAQQTPSEQKPLVQVEPSPRPWPVCTKSVEVAPPPLPGPMPTPVADGAPSFHAVNTTAPPLVTTTLSRIAVALPLDDAAAMSAAKNHWLMVLPR